MKRLRVSVITVSRNSAGTIGASLRSVKDQSWPHIEHIVVDGASTDTTLDVVATEGSHVAKIVSEPDRGIYDAMNKGIRLATGDVIAFLNADDFYSNPTVIASVAEKLQTNELSAVLGDVAFFNGSPDRVVRRYRAAHFRPDRIAWGWMPAHPGLFVRARVFAETGLFSTEYRIAGDFEWVARAFRNRALTYAHIPEVLVMMRTGGVSTGGVRNTILLNREVMRACRALGIRTNWLMLLSKYPRKVLEFLP